MSKQAKPVTNEDILENLQTFMQFTADKFNQIDRRFDRLEARMDGLETRMDNIEVRMDGIEVRMEAVETKAGTIESRLSTIERDVFEIKLGMQKMTGVLDALHTDCRENTLGLGKVSLQLDILEAAKA